MVRVLLAELVPPPDEDELPQAATASASAAIAPAAAIALFLANTNAPLQSLVEVVAQTIADQVGADDEQGQEDPREDGYPPGDRDVVLAAA